MTTNYLRKASCMLILIAGFIHAEVLAQTIHYQTETKSKLHMLGDMSRLIGNKPIKSNVYMSKDHMLEKSDEDATLFSVADQKITVMDRKKETYYEIGFDEMTSMFKAMTEETQQEIEDSGEEVPEFEFDLSVEDMGESAQVAGYSANRKLMRIEMKFTAEQTDEDGNTESSSGKFYTLIDMWVSKDVPGYDVMNDYSQNYAETIGEAFNQGSGGGFSGIAQVMQQDPRIGPAMEKAQEEMQKVEGLALKSTSYFVVGPVDQELNVAAVLGSEEKAKADRKEKRKKGLGQLAKGALGRRGISIGNQDTDASASQGGGEITEQQVLVETETLYKMFELVDTDPAIFQVPATYKQIPKPGY